MYVTYADLFQLLILIVTLVSVAKKVFLQKVGVTGFECHPDA